MLLALLTSVMAAKSKMEETPASPENKTLELSLREDLYLTALPGLTGLTGHPGWSDFESLRNESLDFPTDFSDASAVDLKLESTTVENVRKGPDRKGADAEIGRKLLGAIWPVKHSAEVPGDLILGGLMMVHEREDSITCGPVMPQGGVQALETMLYTLDVINRNGLLPNFTIGTHILDDCDKDTYGLEMAVDFIKGKPFSSPYLTVCRKRWKSAAIIDLLQKPPSRLATCC